MSENIPLEQVLKALGEPMRFKIFSLLLERRHCVRSLSGQLGISESAVSQHMKILRQAGLVQGEQFGYHTHYTPVAESLQRLTGRFEEMTAQAQAQSQAGPDHRCACHADGQNTAAGQCCCRKEDPHESLC